MLAAILNRVDMSLIDFLKTRLFTDARKQRFAYIRSIGPRRRAILIAAAFVLCVSVGLQSSLLGSGQPHLINGIIWALVSGLAGAASVTVIGWKPEFVPLLILGQVTANLTWALVRAASVCPLTIARLNYKR